MGAETVIQRIYFINSCGLFFRDFLTFKGTVNLHYFVLNLVSFFCE